MKTLKKISIIVTALLLSPIIICTLLFGIAWLDGYGVFEDYSGWRRVEIPTEIEPKATVKLPNEWNFVVEDGRMKIVDTDGNVIATECYEGWRIDYDKGGVHYDNKDEMDINPALPEDYQDLGNYEFFRGADAACYLYKLSDGTKNVYALKMTITKKFGVAGLYNLFLVFDEAYTNLRVYEKIQKSYLWGGYIDD